MKITAVCGWAIPPRWFKVLVQNYFPEAKVQSLYPSNPFDTQTAEKLLMCHPADLVIGYSLGSLWLLHNRHFLSPYSEKALLAPILAFPKELDLGGKISRSQLRYMIKLLSRNLEDISVLQTFYNFSGLELPEKYVKKKFNRSILIRGLEFLNEINEPPVNALEFITLIGEKDSLLDAEKIKSQLPNLHIIHKAGHAPEPLIAALSQIIQK